MLNIFRFPSHILVATVTVIFALISTVEIEAKGVQASCGP